MVSLVRHSNQAIHLFYFHVRSGQVRGCTNSDSLLFLFSLLFVFILSMSNAHLLYDASICSKQSNPASSLLPTIFAH